MTGPPEHGWWGGGDRGGDLAWGQAWRASGRESDGTVVVTSRPEQRRDGTDRRSTGFRADIQGLRAVAVLLVVLDHADVPGLSGGYVGVDVFFVISGFLITGQLLSRLERTGTVGFAPFYAGRMRRLLAPAALVIVATVVASRIWDTVFRTQAVVTDGVFAALSALNWRLAWNGVQYLNAGAPPSPLQHLWSLAVEEQFYLLWPVLILLTGRLARLRRSRVGVPAVLAVVLGVVVLASLTASVRQSGPNPPFAYFGLHTRAWELAVGALLAVAAPRLQARPLPGQHGSGQHGSGQHGSGQRTASAVAGLGLVAVLGAGVLFTERTTFPGWAALLPVLGTAAVIGGGCRHEHSPTARVLGTRPMRFVGDVSYSWYLWHWPVVVLAPVALGHSLTWPQLTLLAAGALGLAALTWALVEQPCRRSRWPRRAWLAIGPAITASTLACLLVVWASLPSLAGTGTAARLDLTGADPAAILQRALRHALAPAPVPANLTPPLPDSLADQPASSSDGCHADYLAVQQGPCVYGDPQGSANVVLVGDSHAQQWLPALDQLGRQQGWRVVAWTKGSCPMADLPFYNSGLRREYRECDTWRALTLARVQALHPALVLLGQADFDVGQQYDNQRWALATVAALRSLADTGAAVGYLRDTPFPPSPPRDCLASHMQDAAACAFAAGSAETVRGRRGSLAAALHAADVPALDPWPWLCADGRCPVVVDDVLVYRDAAHLSATYARRLVPLLRGWLDDSGLAPGSTRAVG